MLLVVNKKLIDSQLNRERGVYMEMSTSYVLLDVESLGSVISLQNCFIARRRNMIDLLHILPYQYERYLLQCISVHMYHLLLKQAIKIDETIRPEHHFCELWIHNAVLLWEV